ncbi:MAG: hypothetical protein RI959_499 [Pseudomonadota bacterium]
MRISFNASPALHGVAALALVGVLAAGAPAVPAQPLVPSIRLPQLGDSGQIGLTEERRLGDRIARSLYRDPDYLDDPTLLAYVQSIWQPLLKTAQQRGDVSPELAERFAWELMLARDKTVNAFALPGGYLGVHLGLIASVANADELASVLAHELSHVSQRHIARLMTQQSQQAPWMVAAMILGALAANAAKNVDVASAAIAGGQAVALQSQLNFSRDMEREADRVGFGVMTEAGFAGQGFVGMFEKLQQASRLNDDGAFPYLRSHPLTTERVADMRARLPDAQPTADKDENRPQLHAMMAARARVLAERQPERWRALLQSGDLAPLPLQDAATLGLRYGAVLAAAQLRDAASAEQQLRHLLNALPAAAQTAPQQAAAQAVRQLALEAMVMLQMPQMAGLQRSTLLQEAWALPERPAWLLAARSALQPGSASSALRSATEHLQTWTTQNTRDAQAWQLLGQLYLAQQRPASAARAEAEARFAQFDPQGALDRLKAAQTMAHKEGADHVELSILDARTRYAEQWVRQQWQEEQQGNPSRLAMGGNGTTDAGPSPRPLSSAPR